MDTATKTERRAVPWNKGKLLGQKPPLKLKEIWAIRIRLQLAKRIRELALFNLAIDSKLRGRDLVSAVTKVQAMDLTQKERHGGGHGVGSAGRGAKLLYRHAGAVPRLHLLLHEDPRALTVGS